MDNIPPNTLHLHHTNEFAQVRGLSWQILVLQTSAWRCLGNTE